MKDYKYCLWFVNLNSEWRNNTNGFIPHMTIKHSLIYEDALNIYNMIDPININLSLEETHQICNDNEFWALYYNIKQLNYLEKPSWWPNNAHISFLYKYEPISKETMIPLNKYKEIFSNIALVDCNGHYSNWKILKIK